LARKYNEDKSFRITNGGTDKILYQLQTNTFKRIFRELDSDQDDIISCYNVNCNSLTKDLARIINPIIKEMKMENETLNENEFVKAMYHLYDVK
jgi:transcription initiation factor IIE alpha subunit